MSVRQSGRGVLHEEVVHRASQAFILERRLLVVIFIILVIVLAIIFLVVLVRGRGLGLDTLCGVMRVLVCVLRLFVLILLFILAFALIFLHLLLSFRLGKESVKRQRPSFGAKIAFSSGSNTGPISHVYI